MGEIEWKLFPIKVADMEFHSLVCYVTHAFQSINLLIPMLTRPHFHLSDSDHMFRMLTTRVRFVNK